MVRSGAASVRMPHLLQPAGEAALGTVLRRAPLLAFDFDGTLAPIVAHPAQARISRGVADKLRRLAQRLPVAIVTGRSVDDVRGRLLFEPHFIVGNHGAESQPGPGPDATALDGVRALLAQRAEALQATGVAVEDKGLSLALHYRLSRQPQEARALLAGVLAQAGPAVRTFSGKMVENVVPRDAPDKSDAVHALVRRCGVDCAVFVGDDVNDEPVFAGAPEHWLTVRVGREDPHSRARFFLDATAEVGLLLDRMLVHLAAPA